MAQRFISRKIYQRRKRKRFFFFLRLFGFFFLFSLIFLFSIFIFYAKDLPRPEKFSERQFTQSTKIYDRTGKILLYEIYGEERRTIISLSKIPEHLKQAVIITEDANFYRHFGIDFRGILRSILINLKIRNATYGGSTITQQLIRSTFLSNEKAIKRKVREIILAIELDRRYSKDQILEWYLNQVPFGSNAYGVEAASQIYFKKSVSDISLAEAATLTALIQAPSYLSPYGEAKEKLLARKNWILDRMASSNLISLQEAEEAKKENLEFADPIFIKAPHFVIEIIENYLKPRYGNDLNYLKEKGIKVITTLDWELQETAETAVAQGVKINKSANVNNASLVAIDPKTGEILALVGSADWFGKPYPENCVSGVDCLFDPKFNAAVGTKSNPGRQPGSSFKPFAYLTAFEKGYNASTTVIDEETNFGRWGDDDDYIPQNYDGKFRGEVNLRQALAQSLNIPAVKVLLDLASLDDTVKTAEKFGISTLKPPYGPSLVLGGWEVKLIEMVSAYGVFATDGLKVPPVWVKRIEDYQGNIIEENKKTPKRVVSSEPVRMLNDVLSDNEARAPMFGLNSPLYFPDYQVAAKTGTSQDWRDAWTIGYTPSIVAGVWAGNNNNLAMVQKPGIMLSAPIWHTFMAEALLKFPKENFIPPQLSDNNPAVIEGLPVF